MKVVLLAGIGEVLPSHLAAMADVIVVGTNITKEAYANGVKDAKQALVVASAMRGPVKA